jgi:ABC-2 type transport system permease protein
MSLHSLARGWQTARITALSDLLSPGRITAHAMRLTLQLVLVVYLWQSLYAHAGVTAGLTRAMAMSYAVLAVLMLRIRRADRFSARDMLIQHIQYGTIVYWFLRPLSASRYALWRGVGEQAYGFGWAVVGALACLAAGVLATPASPGAAAAFLVTFLIGQSLLYYLALLTDLMCFWAIKNTAVVSILAFTQNMLSGGYAALWYFPGWFRSVSAAMPFEYTIGVPVSFYIGRIPVSDLPVQLAAAAGWAAALAILVRILWRMADQRISAQGG